MKIGAMAESTQGMFDLFEAGRRVAATSLCEECLHPVEPCNEVELQPGGRCEAERCRGCWDAMIGQAPIFSHRCPECDSTFSCEGTCDQPERALCPDCDRGRAQALPCGHLPGGCVRFDVGGRILPCGGQ